MTIRAHFFSARAVLGALLSAAPAHAANSDKREACTEEEIIKAAENFFSRGAKGLAQRLQKVLKDWGRPAAIIQGEEVGGAIGIGVRYGNGRLSARVGPPGRKFSGKVSQSVSLSAPMPSSCSRWPTTCRPRARCFSVIRASMAASILSAASASTTCRAARQ